MLMQNVHPAEILMRLEWVWRFSTGKSAIEGFGVVNGYVALT